MTTQSESDLYTLQPKDRERFGYARALDVCYDALLDFWDRRKADGMKQADLAAAIGKDEGWISKKIQGPANLTFRTFGSLVEAMNGRIEIRILPKETKTQSGRNYSIYAEYCRDVKGNSIATVCTPTKTKFSMVMS